MYLDLVDIYRVDNRSIYKCSKRFTWRVSNYKQSRLDFLSYKLGPCSVHQNTLLGSPKHLVLKLRINRIIHQFLYQ